MKQAEKPRDIRKQSSPSMLKEICWSVDKFLRWPLLLLIHGYQKYLGWLLGGQCRFVPSCSFYAEEAIQRGPLLPALGAIFWRLLRCQPLCKGGEDHVPSWMNRNPRYFIGKKTEGDSE